MELLPWHGFSRQCSLRRHCANLRASLRDRARTYAQPAATYRIVDPPEITVELHRWAEIGERSHVARPATEADRHWVLADRRLRLVLLQAEDDATWRLVQVRVAKQRLPAWR